jgi:hypothetical protein
VLFNPSLLLTTSLNQSKTMQYFPWIDRLRIFQSTLDRVIVHLEFRSVHEYNTVAKVLEQKAAFLRMEADELLSGKAEVPPECHGFERSGQLIASDRGRLSSIAD